MSAVILGAAVIVALLCSWGLQGCHTNELRH